MFAYRCLSLWFRVCSAFGAPVGSLLAFPFFRSVVPSFWSRRCGWRARWVRRWPPACWRPSAASGWCGRWVVAPASAVPALRRLPLSSPLFPWFVCPAVVSRRGGVVFSVWLFVSQTEN